MSDSTGIEWTDSTWNPVVGCTKVSQGCKNCYAKELHDKRHKAYLSGAQLPDQYALPFEAVQLMPERLTAPLHWRKPRRVFVNSVSDLFHEDVPDEYIDRVFAVMALSPQHTFQVLTKRPERMRDYVSAMPPAFTSVQRAASDMGHPLPHHELRGARILDVRWPLPNVWLGTSVEDQQRANERIGHLLATPAAVRFLSCEPLLGPLTLDLDTCHGCRTPEYPDGHNPPLDWVIVGGESGPGARPCDIEWIRGIVGQCRAAGVAVFVKQLGGHAVSSVKADCNRPVTGSAAVAPDPWRVWLKDRKGGDMAEWPKDLRVREFPAVTR